MSKYILFCTLLLEKSSEFLVQHIHSDAICKIDYAIYVLFILFCLLFGLSCAGE